MKHLLLPSSSAMLSEKKKIVKKIISDGTAFGFHVEDAHRRKIREWERFAVTHDDAFEENNERRKSVSEESDCVFVEFMLAKWEYCMLEMGKSDPKRVLQAAQAFAVVMGLEDHLYSLEHSKTDLCQEITSKLTAPGRFNSSRKNSFRKDSLRKMRRQGRRWKRNVMPDHVAPEPPSRKTRRPTRLSIDKNVSYVVFERANMNLTQKNSHLGQALKHHTKTCQKQVQFVEVDKKSYGSYECLCSKVQEKGHESDGSSRIS